MQLYWRWGAVGVLLLWGLGMAGGCGSGGPDQTIENWIQKRVQIINSDDKKTYLETVHPLVRKGINDSNRFYFDKMFDNELSRQIPDDYTVEPVQEVPADVPLSVHEGITFPMAPTHQVGISYQKAQYSYGGFVWFLVKHQGKWYQLFAIPNADGVQALRKAKEDGIGLWSE